MNATPIPSRLVALAFLASAAFHAAAILFPAISEPSPAWRHALFAAVDTAYAAAFARRPRWLLLAFLPLAAQQLVSHGAAFLEARAAGKIDWQSAVVLASLPLFAWVAWPRRSS